MKKAFAVTAAIVLLGICIAAQANITIETVAVGNAGNVGEPSGGTWLHGSARVCGSVGYNYNIGKYEVTAGQYTAFLNARANVSDTYGLYNSDMWSSSYGCKIRQTGTPGNYIYTVASDLANRPVNYVSYWDACRFANWLGNGQGTGSTETGAYTLGDYNGLDGRTIVRNPGAKWAVTSEDEWYKAAYYDPNKAGGAGYWDYATGSDAIPGRDLADVSGNNANLRGFTGAYPIAYARYTTVAGEFQNSDSAYGTFDQCGNVWEWNETVVYQTADYSYRGLRGGSFADSDYSLLNASDRHCNFGPTFEDYATGFRVSQVVPESSSFIALAGGLASMLGIRRRRA